MIQMYNPFRGVLVYVTYKYVRIWEKLGFIRLINNMRVQSTSLLN